MKYRFLIIICSLLLASCQYFDTEKISSETFYEEELKTINWEDVDQYPSFKACENLTEKLEQKSCFERTLSEHMYVSIGANKMISNSDIDETILVHFSISEEGKISNLKMSMDSIVKQNFPQMQDWIQESIDSIPHTEPAYKRGIPVVTKFVLPIVIKTETTTD